MTVGANIKSCYFSIKQVKSTLQILEQKTTNKQSAAAYKRAYSLLNEVEHDLNKQLTFVVREEPQYK